MATISPDSGPIGSYDDLLSVFRTSEKPRDQWRVGTEAEKFGVFAATGNPIVYDGDAGIQRIFRSLVTDHGWTEESEYEGGPVISLRRGQTSITLEPGCQLELSGAPDETVHETCVEFRDHMSELGAISAELGIRWLGVGFHPFARREELPWVPKLRYAVMREYLPTRGSMALDMMQRTCTVQANFDYASEASAMRLLRLSLRISPIVTAMFANSPFAERKNLAEVSRRARVWLNMDPDRTGLLPFAWQANATYADYANWALDVPMFMVKRGGRTVHNTGQTFRDFWKRGWEGEVATLGDWESHLGTMFPEVRLKRTLEVRGADSQRTSLTCALPALWKGLLYSEKSLDALEALTERFTHDDLAAIRPAVGEQGLKAELYGERLAAWAERIMDISYSGLEEGNRRNARGDHEGIHLKRLSELVAAGTTPAEMLLSRVRTAAAHDNAILEFAQV